jgi:hypothetical protein
MTDTPQPDGAPAPRNPSVSNEPSDADTRGVLWFAGALVAVAVVVHLALWGMFAILQGREDHEKRSHYPLSVGERGQLPQTRFGSPQTGDFPPAPRLEGLAGPDRGRETAADKVESEERRLSSSGADVKWRTHISIEQAMRLVAEESKPQGREPAPPRYDGGPPDTGGGSNSGRNLPEAKR